MTFDLSDVIAKLDANVENLKKNLTPEILYDWQIQQQAIEALEHEADHYRAALDKIARTTYYTAEGAHCQDIARRALRDFTPVVDTNDTKPNKEHK